MPLHTPDHRHAGGRLLPLLALLVAGACSDPSEPAAVEASVVGLYRVGDVQDPSRPSYHDFGEVQPGANLEHTFEFENGSANEISILRMASSCSCTIPALQAVLPDGSVVEGDPFHPNRLLVVPPGAVAKITLRVDPSAVQQANRDKLVTVRITTDSPQSTYLSLEAHLVVREHFQIAPDEASFGRVASSVGAATEITLLRLNAADRSVGRVLASPEGVEAEVRRHPTAPEGTWLLTVRVRPDLEPAALSGPIEIETIDGSGTPTETLTVPVRALIVADIGVSPPLFALRRMEGGLGHEVELVSRVPGRRLAVERATILGPLRDRLQLTLEPQEPDPLGRAARWTLRLSGAPLAVGESLEGDTVEVLLDDTQTPRIEIPITTNALR